MNATLHGDEFGTPDKRKHRDIVIVDGDPMTDSEALPHVVTTVKDGKVVFPQ